MRLAYLIGFLSCGGLLGYGYYLQHFEYLDPCPLCMIQRLAFYGMGIFFLIGALAGRARRTVATVVTLFGILGILTAGRHLWLQSLPPGDVPDCTPGLEYMLETLPLTEVVAKLFVGSGDCAEVSWSFLGISMPGWALLWYLMLSSGALYFGFKSRRRRLFRDT